MIGGDILVGAIVIISGLVALARGFVREVLSLAAWVGAAFVTLWGFAMVRPYAREAIGWPLAADFAAGIGLFLASLFVFAYLSHWFASKVRGGALTALDRTLGLAFGLARGAVIVGLGYLALSWAIPQADHPPWVREARSLPLVQQTAEFLRNLAPPEFRGRVQAPANQTGERARQIQDLGRALRALDQPAANQPAPQGETGYKTEDRRGLERLFQGAGPAEPETGGR